MSNNPFFGFNTRLYNKEVNIAELITNLERFPQEAVCSISNNTFYIHFQGETYFLNEDGTRFLWRKE